MKSEARFKIIFDKMPWGVELYDENGVLVDINQTGLNVFDVTREQAAGLNVFENPNIPKYVSQSLRNGEGIFFPSNYDFKVASRNGHYDSHHDSKAKHLLIKGVTLKDSLDNIFGYIYIIFDDTENHVKRGQTENSLAQLKVSVDTGDSILWEYDVENDKLTVDFGLNEDVNSNGGLKTIHDYNFKNQENYKSSIHPGDFDRVYNKQFKPLLRRKINNFIAAYKRILSDKTFWFNSNVHSYKFNDNGTPNRIVSHTSNVTRQREKKIELIKVKEADKLRSAFLANMSHEIRTPLNAIVGFSNIIAEIDDEVGRQSCLDTIHKNNDLLLQLIDDILDFSKIETGTVNYHFEKVDIKGIYGEIALADSIKMPPDVILIFDLGSPPVIAKTDERKVIQVISNFVNNAIEFTAEGNIAIYYEIEEGLIQVCMKNTSIGIFVGNQRRIFERFIEVNTFQQGIGLELTIGRAIVKALGGKIGVDSEERVGPTFWFTLPLGIKRTDVELSLDIFIQSEETPRSGRHHSILIAEDVCEDYFLLETLSGKQYQLCHTLNGQEAIDMFETYHPDLILMDTKMPVMDGFKTTRRVRTLSRTIPIIALTALAFEKEEGIAKQCEFTDYVVRLIDIKELKKLVTKVLA